MKTFRSSLVLFLLVAVGGCVPGGAKDALVLSPESLQLKQLQTRRFSGISEVDMLSACSGVIQDLGFNLDESEVELGVIVASKSRMAIETGQIAAKILLAALFSGGSNVSMDMHMDVNQNIRASIVTRPVPGEKDEFFVRITFQRQVWNEKGNLSKQESIEDEEIYQEFFAKLSKSVFLEAHKI
jgi:hypothetical protein